MWASEDKKGHSHKVWEEKEVYLICSVQFLFKAEEGTLNFPVKFSNEWYISEAWKLILLLQKRTGNRSFVEMQTAKRTEIETC